MFYDFHITNLINRKEISRVTPQHQVQIIAGVVDLVPISGIRFIEIDRCFRIVIYNTDNSFVFNHCSNLQFRVRLVVLWSVKCIYYLLLYYLLFFLGGDMSPYGYLCSPLRGLLRHYVHYVIT